MSAFGYRHGSFGAIPGAALPRDLGGAGAGGARNPADPRRSRGRAHAKSLSRYLDDAVVLQHRRRLPGRVARIDHVAVSRSGVWVIDDRVDRGRVTVSRPLFGPAKLMIDGRDQTDVVDALASQVAIVRAVLAKIMPAVPVYGGVCFLDAELPLLGRLSFDGFALAHPRGLARQIRGSGPLTSDTVRSVAATLAQLFPGD